MSTRDPFVPRFEIDGVEVPSVPLTAEEVESADAVLLITDHSNVDYGLVVRQARLVLDTRNALRAFADDKVVRL
jgi:UDP-N-acetyl-D-glucosamine dehydrogenase